MRIIYLLAILLVISCKPDTSGTTAEPATPSSSAKSTKTKDGGSSSAMAGTATTDGGSTSLADKEQRSGMKASPEDIKKHQEKITKSATKKSNSAGIPDACALLSPKTIAKHLSISEAGISVTDGSSKQNNLQRACFFKWDDPNMKNAGVMVQVQQNPVADDVPEYFTFMVQSLKSQGETDMTGLNMKYVDWPGHGDDAAYSAEAGKYVWRIGQDWAFMVAFNTTQNAKTQKAAAEAIAKEIMDKMTF